MATRPKRLLGNDRMNIAAVATPIALLAGFTENAEEGTKIGRIMVKKLTNSHIELNEALNRSDMFLASTVWRI